MINNQTKITFSNRRPILAVIIIQLLLLFAVTASGTVATIKELHYTSSVLLSFIPMALVLIIYLSIRRKWRSAIGFKPLHMISSGSWVYYMPLVAVLMVILSKGLKPLSISEIIFFIFFTLLVGFLEETIYRGLIFHIMLQKSRWAAVLVSSLLFGITHVLNALSGADASAIILQIVYSLLVGLTLALLMLKGGNIIPLILFHFAHNLFQFLGEETYPIGYDLVIMAILFIQCLWLLQSLRKTPVTKAIPPSVLIN